MAKSSDIKQKIVLEGEKEYVAAIKDANRNLKVLKSALKAETAEMGRNATAQQKAEVKAKSLKQQIAEQENIVKTLTDALEQAKNQYGDNADVVAKWETQLNNARATLGDMRDSLENVGEGFKVVEKNGEMSVVATKTLAESLESLSSVGDSISGALEGVFNTVFDHLKGAAAEIWDIVSETAAKANNWGDLAGFYGSSASAMQRWSRSIEDAGGNFDDFITLVNQFSFGGKNDKITEWFAVSDASYTDNLQYTVAVLQSMVDLREEMVKAGTWDKAMTEVFGSKRSQTASWFVDAWSGILEAQAEYDKHGYNLGEEELATLSDVSVMISSIETKWDALRDKVAGGLGTATLEILTNVSGAMDAFADVLNAEPGSEEEQAALDALTDNIEEACEKAAEAIERGLEALRNVGEKLSGSDNWYVATIGNIMKDLTGSLEWIVQHQEEVKIALGSIFGVWFLAKIAAIGGKLTSIVAQIETIKAFKNWKMPTDAASAAAGAAGSGAAGASAAGGAGAAGAAGTAAAVTKYSLLPSLAAVWGIDKIVKQLPASLAEGMKEITGQATEDDRLLQEAQEKKGIKTVEDMGREMLKNNNEQNRKVMDTMLGGLGGALFGGNKESGGAVVKSFADETEDAAEANGELADAAEEAAEAFEGLAATAEQIAAAERFWDAWRAYGDDSSDENDRAFDEAYDAFEAAFAGQEELFDAIDSLMEQLKDEGGDKWTEIQDLPASWWQNAGGRDMNISTEDLRGFRSLPGMIAAAVESAAASGTAEGVSGISITLDGYAVGRAVAPYVSQSMARGLIV